MRVVPTFFLSSTAHRYAMLSLVAVSCSAPVPDQSRRPASWRKQDTGCVDLDLEKFFDRVNHDKLMGQIAKRVEDKRLRKLIRAFLNAGVMENGLVSPSVEGTPQGGPLSPLLSNLVLDELDRELERRSHRFVRYADDCNIYVRSERAGQRVMESITRFRSEERRVGKECRSRW